MPVFYDFSFMVDEGQTAGYKKVDVLYDDLVSGVSYSEANGFFQTWIDYGFWNAALDNPIGKSFSSDRAIRKVTSADLKGMSEAFMALASLYQQEDIDMDEQTMLQKELEQRVCVDCPRHVCCFGRTELPVDVFSYFYGILLRALYHAKRKDYP